MFLYRALYKTMYCIVFYWISNYWINNNKVTFEFNLFRLETLKRFHLELKIKFLWTSWKALRSLTEFYNKIPCSNLKWRTQSDNTKRHQNVQLHSNWRLTKIGHMEQPQPPNWFGSLVEGTSLPNPRDNHAIKRTHIKKCKELLWPRANRCRRGCHKN